jgi:RNA polymerase sporulation-specific sigma factor
MKLWMEWKRMLLKMLVLCSRRLQNHQGIWYINGPETLPPPLTRQEEQYWFERLEQNDPEARQMLITQRKCAK